MKNTDNTIIIYANSSLNIGGGHVMRQIALAQQAKLLGFHSHFVFKHLTDSHKKRLTLEGFTYEKLNTFALTACIEKLKACAVVIDDYEIDADSNNHLQTFSVPIITFDDQVNDEKIIANIIVNSADNITPLDYVNKAKNATYCLGHQYRLIRQEFLDKTKQSLTERKNLLISIGATDTLAITLPLIKLFVEKLPDTPIDIIIGDIHPTQEQALFEYADLHKQLNIHQHATDMSVLMKNAKLAITGAGGTLFELAAMGIPAIALCVVKNQTPIFLSKAHSLGFYAFDLSHFSSTSTLNSSIKNETNNEAKAENHDLVLLLQSITSKAVTLWQNEHQLEEMSRQQRNYIDGNGSQRVMNILLEEVNKNSE